MQAVGWSKDSWRAFPAAQPVEWPDPQHAARVRKHLAELPPLIFAGEARNLTAELGKVAQGEAFLLQAGDCAESFDGVSADWIRDQVKVILQMALVLTYGTGTPVVKVVLDGGSVREAAKRSHRGSRRRTHSVVPRPHPQQRDEDGGRPRARPRPHGPRVQHVERDAKPDPRVHVRRVRSPRAGALLEQGFRRVDAGRSDDTNRSPPTSTEPSVSCGRAASTQAVRRSRRRACGRVTKHCSSTTRNRSLASTRSRRSHTAARPTCCGSVSALANSTARTSSTRVVSTTRSGSRSVPMRRPPTWSRCASSSIPIRCRAGCR